jgi:hypothetical protein
MTPFQVVAVVLFAAVVVAAYHKELLAGLKKLAAGVKTNGATSSSSNTLVSDLVTVTDLRERLAAQGCRDGADTCTNLLRVMIESTNYQR